MATGSGEIQDRSRSSMVSVRLAPEEQKYVRAEALKRGTSMSQFVREAVLEKCAPSQSANVNDYVASATKVIGLTMQLDDDFKIVPQAAGIPIVQLR